MMRPMAFTRMGGMEEDGVSITKAENGYMVTLLPKCSFDDIAPGAFPMMERPEPHEIEKMRESREKSRPRVFVYHGLDDAWTAIKEFLMDGRMPKNP